MQPLVRKELIHTHFGLSNEDFFKLIDETGGWPLGYSYVSFYHDGPCGNRYCQFTTNPLRTEWWTTICSADDYYYSKLSQARKLDIVNEAKQQVIRQLR